MKGVFNHNEFWKCYLGKKPGFREKDEKTGEFWDKMAEHYESSSSRNTENNTRDFQHIDTRPGDTILDIGAGNGRLSVLMASEAGFVTALDPSKGMLSMLDANMKKAGLKNYKTICSRWEDIPVPEDTGVHDIVVCSFALGFYDLRAALEKMDKAASRSVCLFWFAGRKHDDGLVPYIRELKGLETEAALPYPDYQYVINILHEMDICADLSIETYDWKYPFESPDEAVEQALHFKKIGPEDREAAYGYYLDSLEEDEDGTLVLRTQADQAFIKWDK